MEVRNNMSSRGNSWISIHFLHKLKWLIFIFSYLFELLLFMYEDQGKWEASILSKLNTQISVSIPEILMSLFFNSVSDSSMWRITLFSHLSICQGNEEHKLGSSWTRKVVRSYCLCCYTFNEILSPKHWEDEKGSWVLIWTSTISILILQHFPCFTDMKLSTVDRKSRMTTSIFVYKFWFLQNSQVLSYSFYFIFIQKDNQRRSNRFSRGEERIGLKLFSLL